MTSVQPGKIIEIDKRVYKIATLTHDDEGALVGLTCECLNPKRGGDKWFYLRVVDEDKIHAHTLH